jgi:hypothetical protein
MDIITRVSDERRKNPLSKIPGGSVVSITWKDGRVSVYDKVKSPEKYISRLNRINDIQKIEVDGEPFTY